MLCSICWVSWLGSTCCCTSSLCWRQQRAWPAGCSMTSCIRMCSGCRTHSQVRACGYMFVVFDVLFDHSEGLRVRLCSVYTTHCCPHTLPTPASPNTHPTPTPRWHQAAPGVEPCAGHCSIRLPARHRGALLLVMALAGPCSPRHPGSCSSGGRGLVGVCCRCRRAACAAVAAGGSVRGVCAAAQAALALLGG